MLINGVLWWNCAGETADLGSGVTANFLKLSFSRMFQKRKFLDKHMDTMA